MRIKTAQLKCRRNVLKLLLDNSSRLTETELIKLRRNTSRRPFFNETKTAQLKCRHHVLKLLLGNSSRLTETELIKLRRNKH